jgi:glycosyltransferase involved in cell wall biosynthesis
MDASREIIENQKDDCEIKAIISSSWPITSHIIAKDLKIHYNLPWIADLRDLWNLNPYISHTFIRNYFEKKLEKNTFKYADALTTTTDLAAETLKTLHPTKKIIPILSGFDLEDVTSKNVASGDVTSEDIVSKDMALKNHIDINDDKLNFIYGGSLYDGKRDPTFLFKALSQLIAEKKVDSSKIAIDFYGDSGNLEKIAKKYELNNIINIYGRVPHKKLIEKQKKADVLLLLSWNNPNEKMFLPGKIYEYLAIKSPILSIGYKEGSLKDLIEKTNIGFHVSDLNQTKIAILKFYNEFIKKGKLNYSGNNEVNSYSLLNTSEKFANLLNSIQNKQ